MKKQALNLVLLTVCALSSLGTTYVIKEGGKEVGRYDENDGKNEVVEMGSQPPARAPQKAPAEAKPAAKKVDVWGVRRGPKVEGFEAGANPPSIEDALAQSQKLQAQAEAKRIETERAIAEAAQG